MQFGVCRCGVVGIPASLLRAKVWEKVVQSLVTMNPALKLLSSYVKPR